MERKNNAFAKSIARSSWIDDLSEEEQKVLEIGHKIDTLMRQGKYDKRIKVGVLDDIGVED